MITLKTTNPDGSSKELVFENRREAVSVLRDLFGTDAMRSERQRVRDETNDTLRSLYLAKSKQISDPEKYFQHGSND